MKDHTKDVLHHKAEFLNRPGDHEDASIFSHVIAETSILNGVKMSPYFNSTFKIRDCNKDLWLDFPIEEIDNNTFKLDVMINHLQEFKKALIDAHYLYAQFQNEKKD